MILNSTPNDIDDIFKLYEIATKLQIKKNAVVWPEFEKKLIETEITENRQWKLIIENEIACVWATTFDDPQIWEEKNINPSIYIHRIATNSKFKGLKLVDKIVEWSKIYALENNKHYIRLDTVAGNPALIKHYQNSGFDYLGDVKLQNTIGLPTHYNNATVSLFEIKI